MLRVVLPLAAALFIVLSLAFFGGWPFEKTDAAPSAEQSAGSGNGTRPRGRRRPEPQERAPSSEDLANKELEELRSRDVDAYLHRLSALVLDVDKSPAARARWLDDLRSAARKRVFVEGSYGGLVRETVRRGDNLTKIARRVGKAHGLRITPQALQWWNGMENDRIRPNQKLLAPKRPLSILVRKSEFRLFLRLGDLIIADYPVGIGRENRTPEGSFKVAGKAKKPDWTMPNRVVVAYGDPRHQIGNRWMRFDTESERTSFGIHGTVEPTSVGRAESDGCLRMRKNDLEELFDLVPNGCAVRLEP